jgi:hypothetical protein
VGQYHRIGGSVLPDYAIIYDNSYPLLFSEGDFIITTQENVKGIIEVKTRVVNANEQDYSLRTIIEKFNELSVFDMIADVEENRMFKGLFSYDYGDNFQTDRIAEVLRLSNGMINHLSLGQNVFIRHWRNGIDLQPPVECQNSFYNIYEINDLSFSYFISNLIHIVTDKEMDERYWFSFPIQGTKEQNRRSTICL